MLVRRFVPGPSVERGHALNIYCHPKEPKLIYGFGKYVVIKSLREPTDNFVFRGHKYNVGAAQFSPNGAWVASGDAGGFLRVWAWDNPEHRQKLENQALGAAILDLSWDSESKRICLCGDGKGVVAKCVMWDTGNTVGEMVGHNKKAITCAYKPSRPFRIFTGSEDYKVFFYKGPPFKMDHSNSEHKNYVNCVRFSKTGDVAASVGSDKKIVIYDGPEGKVLTRDLRATSMLDHHQGSIYSLAFSPTDSSSLMTAGADKTIKLWTRGEEAATPLVASLTVGEYVGDMQLACIWQPHMSPVTVSLDGSINTISPDLSEIEAVSYAPQSPISCVAVVDETPIVGCNDGTVFYIGDEGQWMKLVNTFADVNTKQPHRPCHAGKVTDVVAVSDTTFATCGFDDKIKFANVTDGYVSDGVSVEGQPCALATFRGLVYVATTRGVALVRDDKRVKTFVPTTYDPTTIAASVDGTIAVGAKDGSIRILDASTLEETKCLAPHRGEITALTFAPDGKTLAAGDADRDIKLYNLPDFTILLQSLWRFHTSRVTALAWRPDSTYLASTASDESVYVWNKDKPSQPGIKLEFTHKDGVTGLAFQGLDFLYSVGNDANALKWKPL